ncbi:protein SPIRAL [Salix suchowensis]|nr:protein SPIRAL [Salix suchowensis]
MGRGVGAGGAQSSSGYLFGTFSKACFCFPVIDKQTPAGIHGNRKNNYCRADGQNLDRPSTKVHAAPGGGSSLATCLALSAVYCLALIVFV